MFTPEDEIDEIHRELGVWRRRKDDAERSRGKPGTDYVEVDKWLSRCGFHVARLERALADEMAKQRAADEAYGKDAA